MHDTLTIGSNFWVTMYNLHTILLDDVKINTMRQLLAFGRKYILFYLFHKMCFIYANKSIGFYFIFIIRYIVK